MKIYAVVPVYNESPTKLNSVLADLSRFVDDIVVIDDGSNNYSYKLQVTSYKLLTHDLNRGQGAALQTGTDYAVRQGADIIVHFDADGQHNADDIPDLIKPIQTGQADFVFGSRFLGKNSNMPWSKKNILQPMARFVNLIFTNLKLSDAHNGLRAFNVKIADKIYLTQDRMAHNTEYSRLVKKNNIRYAEAAVKVNYSEYGQGVKDGVRVVRELVTGKIIK